MSIPARGASSSERAQHVPLFVDLAVMVYFGERDAVERGKEGYGAGEYGWGVWGGVRHPRLNVVRGKRNEDADREEGVKQREEEEWEERLVERRKRKRRKQERRRRQGGRRGGEDCIEAR